MPILDMKMAMNKEQEVKYMFHRKPQSNKFTMIWIFSFLLLQKFLTKKDKVVDVTRIVYFSERAFVLGFLGPQRALK